MESFPPNSARAAGPPAREPKKVERVTSGEAVRRKPPLGRRFVTTFFSGDGKTAIQHAAISVIVPKIRDLLYEAGRDFWEYRVYGTTFGASRGIGRSMGGMGQQTRINIPYGQMGNAQQRPQVMSQKSRARHDFDEIVMESRQDAHDVLEQMFDILGRFEQVTVADLYTLTGVRAEHTDHKWGWISLQGAGVIPVRGGGFMLNLPKPTALG